MFVRVLGSAAGGGFPQWNCACANCQGVRSGKLMAKPRTQSQMAISTDGRKWHLLNASPDLRQQIHAYPELQPSDISSRNSPIQSVILTNADIDHTLGLLLLRESQPLHVYSTDHVRTVVQGGNTYFKMLDQFQGHSQWSCIEPGLPFMLKSISGENSGLQCTAISLGGRPPFWASKTGFIENPRAPFVIGLIIEEVARGKRLGYFPGVNQMNQELLGLLEKCDAIFIDGTFWDDEELIRLRPGSRTAKQMQHMPISGKGGSLESLAELPQNIRKFFTHINNTNPVLNEQGCEHKLVHDAGWGIAFDGLELQL